MAFASTRHHALVHLRRHLSSATVATDSSGGGGHAFDSAIRRLAKSKSFSDIESLLEPRKLHLPDDPSARESHLASLITAYACAGMLDHALRTLDELPRLGSPRTLLSLNAFLSACNHSKNLYPRVPAFLSDLSRAYSLSPDKVSYGILIKSICLARDASKALSIFKEMDEKQLEITSVSYTTVIDSLYKEGKPEEAERLWREMLAKGVVPDAAAYNVKVMYRAKNGNLEDVLGLMEGMKAAGIQPDAITYNYLMSCYCGRGRFEDAKRVYRELEEKGCEPNVGTFKNLLHALCKNDDFEGGLEVFEDSVKRGKVPDLGSVMMLVKGLMKGSKVRAAKRVVSGLRKKFPEDFAGGWKDLENVVGLST